MYFDSTVTEVTLSNGISNKSSCQIPSASFLSFFLYFTNF